MFMMNHSIWELDEVPQYQKLRLDLAHKEGVSLYDTGARKELDGFDVLSYWRTCPVKQV